MHDRQESPPPRNWVNTKAVAKHLGLCERTVSSMHREGRIPGYRNGSRIVRFDLAEVDAAMERNPQPSAVDDFIARVLPTLPPISDEAAQRIVALLMAGSDD